MNCSPNLSSSYILRRPLCLRVLCVKIPTPQPTTFPIPESEIQFPRASGTRNPFIDNLMRGRYPKVLR
jgi:hypothetical protein